MRRRCDPRPGALPYHMPSTPSYFGRGKRLTIWLPNTAVAARSSFRPDEKTTLCSREELGIALERLVEAAERRAAVARDERRRVEAARGGRRDAGRAAGAPAPGCRTGRHGRAPACTWRRARTRRASSSCSFLRDEWTWSANRPRCGESAHMVCGNAPRTQRGRALTSQQRAQVGPEAVRDDPVALGRRVNAVGLIQARVAATPSRKNGMNAALRLAATSAKSRSNSAP